MFNLYPWRAVFQGFLAIAIILPGLPIVSVPAPELSTKTRIELQTDYQESKNGKYSSVELDYIEVATLPQFLPYSLDYAVEVADVGDSPATAVVNVALPTGTMPESTLSQELVHLFYFQEATETWQKLPTQRTFEEDVWHLQAQAIAPGIYAAALSTTNDYGDYAQPWQPTVSEAQVDLFTGAVQWSYPLDVPGGRSDLAPALALSYHSGIVDNLTGKGNPQPDDVAMGWNLGTSYIARKIQPDPNDGVPEYLEEYTLVLNGVSSELIPLGDNQYALENERFWRIERIEENVNRGGDYWRVTLPNGVQYRFGYQDETAGPDSRESAWWMVTAGANSEVFRYTNWRWNLDEISDRQGNIVRLDYARETNDFVYVLPESSTAHIYSQGRWCNGAYECPDGCTVSDVFYDHCYDHMAGDSTPSGYTRGGHLEQITYSWPNARYKVTFETSPRDDYEERFDSRRKHQLWQTFWSSQRLQNITVYSVNQGQMLRRYELAASERGDILILDSIQEVAADGTRLPAMTFDYHHLAGYRKNGASEGAYKYWLAEIHNGYGGITTFNITEPEPNSFQSGQTANPDPDDEGRYWYRYRVRKISTNPIVGLGTQTRYRYLNLDSDTPHAGTWIDDEFYGHPRVRVMRYGPNNEVLAYSDHYFFQGIPDPDEDSPITAQACDHSLTDEEGLQGHQYLVTQHGQGRNERARTETAWYHNFLDVAEERYFVGVQAICNYPDGGSGPYSKTEYEYDDYGNVTQETHYGDVTQSGDEVFVSRDYVYNTDPSIWIVNTVQTETLRETAGSPVVRQTRYAYDGQAVGQPPTEGNVTLVEQGRDDWGWVTTRTQYDAWGNPEVITDARGHATHTVYDDLSHQFPVAVTNAASHTTSTQWDLRLGVPEIITDANGAATHLTYDSFGRVTAVTPPGDVFPAVKYTYPSGDTVNAPFVVKTETRIDAYQAAPQYQTAWTIYDGLGRVIQTQTEAEASPIGEGRQLVLQSTAYDALGRPVTATLPYTVAAVGGTYHSPNWVALPKSVTTYDALGRVIQVQAADGNVTRKAYQAWQELVLDAEGHQTVYKNDGLGRLTTVREYYGTYSAPDWNAANPARTHYTYDPQGNLTQVTDALGHVTRITYDPLGRKTWMDDPSMGEWVYEYDDAGNLIAQTDAEGQRLTFHYDELNRLTHKFHAGDLLAEYGYDQGLYGIGQRTTMTDTSGTAAWQYDVQGRTLAETKTIAGAGTFVTAWDYDAAGRVITTTYPTGEAVRTAYNLRGLPTGVTGLDAYLTGATYNAARQPLRQTWGNTRRTTYAYDTETLRLQSLQVSGNLLDLAYTYDDVGNLRTITDAGNAGQVQTFTYDARDRLLTAHTTAAGQGQYHETYGYDLMGNIITRTVGGDPRTYTYGRPPDPGEPVTPTLPHVVYLPIIAYKHDPHVSTIRQPFAVVATSAGFRAAYDLNGNMLARVEVSGTETITYTQEWNVENRLSVVTNTVTGDVTRFVYDGDGARVLREDANGLTAYVGAVEVTISGTQRFTTSYYFAGGQRVAMREGVTLTYLHGDHLGSASLATDEGGAQVSAMRYTPFGETRYGDTPTDFRFTGQREEDFGLYDYGARFYSPGLGRFVSADTIIPDFANPQSLNRYTYVYNRSLVFADQSGHFPWPLVGVVVGGVIVGGVVGVIVTPEVLPWNPPVVFTDRVAEPITSSDMTGWLRNQMVSNAQSDVVQAIRGNWTSHNILQKDAAMQAWAALVGTGAIWDFKVDIEETSWFEKGIRDVTLGDQALNFDAVANMHFGFVGRAAGFDADLLMAAAGFAQAKRALETNDPNDWGACDMSHYCDHPFATWSIGFGIYLYDLYQYRLNELDDAAFASALEEYIQKFGELPSPPPGAISP